MTTAAAVASGRTWFGHPRGLATLFFTEMWERFSYYGMRALLMLFMTAAISEKNPGMGMSVERAAAIYGLYTGMVYLLALPGGWVADKLWGQKKAVFIGGIIIAAGHFSMAYPSDPSFYLGLILIVIGTGLLKPNVSAIVGDLYPEGGARRDAGFSIFYMGINIGALAGPTFCGLFGEGYNWHWGFSLAGIGMVLGLIQYKLGASYLAGAGELSTGDSPEVTSRLARTFYSIVAAVLAAVALLAYAMNTGMIPLTIQQLVQGLGYGIIILAIVYFVYLIGFAGYDAVQKKRLMVIFWLFILAAVFWSGFEQAGSSMNLFAFDLTDRVVFGWEMPASWLQNINPFFIIIFAPIFGTLWTSLARRNANPSIPMKFALGLVGLAAGFFVLAWGAANASVDNKVSPAWLIVTYFFHTVGELSLSPVGLSSITKLAPRDRVGQMMGVWFVGAALGNLLAGLFAGRLESLAPSALFWNVAVYILVAAIVALLAAPFVKRLIGNLE
ncbi:MAG TPA: peptide MFS transporter [Thermoanaerobaculia bacterium]|nr:peptide MFS transporter [Thermoanaerobaculia bacterium]